MAMSNLKGDFDASARRAENSLRASMDSFSRSYAEPKSYKPASGDDIKIPFEIDGEDFVLELTDIQEIELIDPK